MEILSSYWYRVKYDDLIHHSQQELIIVLKI